MPASFVPSITNQPPPRETLKTLSTFRQTDFWCIFWEISFFAMEEAGPKVAEILSNQPNQMFANIPQSLGACLT
ncbi:hypothetical protein HI914_01000 [Erysiphe necator]|nr:hypothetical protein HI914_01000 [Erysiphe necator]